MNPKQLSISPKSLNQTTSMTLSTTVSLNHLKTRKIPHRVLLYVKEEMLKEMSWNQKTPLCKISAREALASDSYLTIQQSKKYNTYFTKAIWCNPNAILISLTWSGAMRLLPPRVLLTPKISAELRQGYAEFKQSTWSTIRDFLGARMAFKSCQASRDANDRYCKKDGQYRCFGTIRPGQGARTDLSDVAAAVLEGKKVAHVANEYPVQFIKYHQGITKLIGLQEPQRRQKPWVLWLWGPPGTGKSKSAFEIAERCNSFYYKDLTTWWDNYEQQECVILDDFRPNTGDRTNNDSTISYQYMLKLLDRYPLMVQRKGGYMNFNSSIIIITAPMTPRDMFAHVTEDILQLTRRIDHVVHFPALIPDATAANLLAPMQDVPAPLAASFNPPRAPLMPLLNHGSNENDPPESVVEPTSVALAIADWIDES